MSFKYTLVPASLQNEHRSLLDLAQEYVDAKADLESHLGKLPEIDNVMDSITHSLEALSESNDPSGIVHVLNVDKSLEQLLGVAESSITVKTAKEGLGEALKKAWETFKEWCKSFWQKVSAFFKKIWYWITGRDKADKEAAEYTDALIEDTRRNIERITKASNDLAKKSGEARAERMRAELKKKLDDIARHRKKAAEKVQAATKDFKKTAEDPKSTVKQVDDASKKVHEATREYHEVSKEVHTKAKHALAESPVKREAAAAQAAPPAVPPSLKPTPAPPPPPPPPEPKEYEAPVAGVLKAALPAFKQLNNAFMASWNAQAKGVKDAYDQFVKGDLNAEDAKKAKATIIESINTVVKVANAALEKVDEHINEESESEHISWKLHDSAYESKYAYRKFKTVQEIGFASTQEAFDLCTELRQTLSSVSRAVGKAADDWYLDMMAIDDRFDADDKLDDAAKATLSRAMSVYRTGTMMERLALLVCQLTGTWCCSGTADIIQCCKDQARAIESRAAACARAVASQLQ